MDAGLVHNIAAAKLLPLRNSPPTPVLNLPLSLPMPQTPVVKNACTAYPASRGRLSHGAWARQEPQAAVIPAIQNRSDEMPQAVRATAKVQAQSEE
ncbi:hypothetical protein Q31a_49410 [Aureliella helgolandensis]|uniref:Uncharacterized protein n=1 Tax=Aureliella helgolandensis TaxID=2527968 RepID=A0A518GDC5_9BACT|nr:hypothetical protein Q31a_49410 [Aureliella helgolandensis]